MPDTTRLIFLGGGAVVDVCYLPAVSQLGWTNSVLVCDPNTWAIDRIAHKHPGVRTAVVDFEECLRDARTIGEYDAAIVALPNRLHEKAVEGALANGLHVLCEKPLSLSAETCRHLDRFAADRSRILAVGMTRRLLPSVLALRKALDAHLIGNLVSIDVTDGEPYAWPSVSGEPFNLVNGGVLADIGIHYLDLLQWLVGPLEPVSYDDDYVGGVEANAKFVLRSTSGVDVRVALSRTHTLNNTAVFSGECGQLILEKHGFDSCIWRSDSGVTGRLSADNPFGSGPWPSTFESCFIQQLADFRDTIRGCPRSMVTANEAATAVSYIESAYSMRRTTWAIPKSSYAQRPALPPSPVVVTGGTGFIGTNLVERLVEIGGATVVAPVRSYSTCAPLARLPVSMPPIDLLDRVAVARTLRGARYVFHLAYGRDGPNARRVTVEGTRNVVEAAIETGAEAIVVLSTIYVFGQPEVDCPIDETAAYAPIGGEYGTSKAEMEKWCLERARTSGKTRIVVLNPSCVYGRWGKTYTTLPITLAREGRFCWVDGGRGRANVVYVDNLVDAMLLAAQTHDAHGCRFIVNDGAVTWKRFLTPLLGSFAAGIPSYSQRELAALERDARAGIRDLIAAVTRSQELRDGLRSRPWVVKAARAAKRSATVRRYAERPSSHSGHECGPDPDPPPAWLGNLYGPAVTAYSAERANRVLGWTSLVHLESGQAETVAYLQQAGLLSGETGDGQGWDGDPDLTSDAVSVIAQ